MLKHVYRSLRVKIVSCQRRQMGDYMELIKNKKPVPFLAEACAFKGVRLIAEKVAADVEKVSGVIPRVLMVDAEMTETEWKNIDGSGNVILAATIGKSFLIDNMIRRGVFTVDQIEGKNEVYKIQLVDHPWDGVDQALVICGSDKRGTIYGLFALSEYIGVSPLCYWGDVEPEKQENILIGKDIETVSKEPSVKYRGFFINDEWPCFGNWTFSHFNGFTSGMYDHVFELLLRLKGNYLWPAMWSSSFPLDGPGSLNEELADIYGVVIGFSHHEPCLRASEEWDKVRGPKSKYGNEWNFFKNKEGLTKYWEDALIRSGKFEKLITIGMRGERDSSMLGEDATLKENIDLLKEIITTQKDLIRKHVNPDLNKVPMLLALYKEVEEYFYGEDNVPGLKEWEGMENVICMLCEDNFGYVRTLPTEELREKIDKLHGGFGMYYHFDYHGGPISYEWMPSAPFSKTWEQMSMAYDYGIRDAWIVNVGDLKYNEVLLAYFLNLAYDFETWGSNAPGSWKEYTGQWLHKTFPKVSEAARIQMGQVLTEYVDMNSMRRPEALHEGIYHPCNYLETDRMLQWAERIEKNNEAVYASLSKREKDAYYSMIYFPAKASINLLRMHLYAGKNAHYARQGKTIANQYADMVTECIREDRRLAEEFALFKDGKWKGMELEQHIGFVTWNEDNCRYPVRRQVEPAYKPRMVVSRKDNERIFHKTYGRPMTIIVDDFLYAGQDEVILEIANDGIEAINYKITVESVEGNKNHIAPEWLSITSMEGNVKMQEEVVLRCDRSKLLKETEQVRLLIQDAETTVAVDVYGKAVDAAGLPLNTFLSNQGVITMEAIHYSSRKDTDRGSFKELNGYGRSGSGMKVFPSTSDFTEEEEAPALTYQFFISEEGIYDVEFWMTPTNSVCSRRALRFVLSDSDNEKQVIEALPADFMAGNHWDGRWCKGVLDQIRIAKAQVRFVQGVQTITISALEAGLVLERILIYQNGHSLKPSYLGPMESYRVLSDDLFV